MAPYIHRNVATDDEFEHYSETWTQKRYVGNTVLYLAMRGHAGTILLGRDELCMSSLSSGCAGRALDRSSTSAAASNSSLPRPTVLSRSTRSRRRSRRCSRCDSPRRARSPRQLDEPAMPYEVEHLHSRIDAAVASIPDLPATSTDPSRADM